VAGKINIKIRLADKNDARKFLKLEAFCFKMRLSNNTMYFWRPVVSYLWTYKATINNKIVGGIIAMPTRDGDWYINSLFVHPRYRKHGIATKLLRKIISIVGKKRIILDVKTDKKYLLDFYGKHDFRVKKLMRNYYRDGTDRYLLVRPS
jgi:ribosomal-protein-alanine N-acetyltransferase